MKAIFFGLVLAFSAAAFAASDDTTSTSRQTLTPQNDSGDEVGACYLTNMYCQGDSQQMSESECDYDIATGSQYGSFKTGPGACEFLGGE